MKKLISCFVFLLATSSLHAETDICPLLSKAQVAKALNLKSDKDINAESSQYFEDDICEYGLPDGNVVQIQRSDVTSRRSSIGDISERARDAGWPTPTALAGFNDAVLGAFDAVYIFKGNSLFKVLYQDNGSEKPSMPRADAMIRLGHLLEQLH